MHTRREGKILLSEGNVGKKVCEVRTRGKKEGK